MRVSFAYSSLSIFRLGIAFLHNCYLTTCISSNQARDRYYSTFKLFEQEAQVLKQLNHPRIFRYRDYFSLDKETGAGLCWFGLVQQYI